MPLESLKSKWRRIVTDIPAPQSIPDIESLRAVEPISMQHMPPILWQQAQGFLVRDNFGNQWIDLTSGIMTANVGHSHPKIIHAIRKALDEELLFSYAFPTDVRRKLLAKLVSLSPITDSKAILFSAGTEATECAMMLMRRHGKGISPSKVGILSFLDSFHGRTLAASLATGTPGQNDWIKRQSVCHYQVPFPFCPRCPWGKEKYDNCGEFCFQKCLADLRERQIAPEHIAGIIAEPMPGWATWPIPRDFAATMKAWTRQNKILLTFDEVQAGCGRTGRFFASEHLGIVPDLLTLGKGLSSSLPVSAVLGPTWLMDIPGPGEMSSTHGGNPVCAAAALACLETIEQEHLVDASAHTGAVVLEKLQKLQSEYPQHFYSIHGRGLFISAHLKRPLDEQPDIDLADAIVDAAVRRGVMMFPTHRGFLKIAPPLCIDPQAAAEAIDVIRQCFIELKSA